MHYTRRRRNTLAPRCGDVMGPDLRSALLPARSGNPKAFTRDLHRDRSHPHPTLGHFPDASFFERQSTFVFDNLPILSS